MKGNPLLRLIIILILLMAVFWPVLKITHPAVVPSPTAAISASSSPQSTGSSPADQGSQKNIASTLRIILLVHAAPSPLHCSIRQGEDRLLSESNAISPGEYRTDVEITKGKDLLVTADWKNEEPHALRVEVLVQGYQAPLEKTFWAQQSLEDTLPIPDSFLP